MFRRSRFSARPNIGIAGRAAAAAGTPQGPPAANQDTNETQKEPKEDNNASLTNEPVVTPSENASGSGDANEQNGEGTSSSASVQRRKRFSIKPKVAPGRPPTLPRTTKSPVKTVSVPPVDAASESEPEKPTTSSQPTKTPAPPGLQSPKSRGLSDDAKQHKTQSKLTPLSSEIPGPSAVSPSEDSKKQTHLLKDGSKHVENVPTSQTKDVHPRVHDRVPPSLPDKEATEISEKAKTLISSKKVVSAISPSALSLSRLLNDPSDVQRMIKAQKLRDLLRQERSKEKNLKRAKARGKEFSLDPTKMTMRDLIHYLPTSNPMTSSLEADEENETVIPPSPRGEQSTEHVPEVPPTKEKPREDEDEEEEEAAAEGEEDESLMVPQVKVAEDGSLIIDEESLTVEVQRAKGPNPASNRDPIFERGSTTTYSSFRKSTYCKPWSIEETDMFYLAVSMVGTDFSMICQLFPHRARTEIKNKFKKEERINSWRIDKAFRERRKLDIEYFSKLLDKILEYQKEKKKLKSLVEKNNKTKSRTNAKGNKGKKSAKNLSDVEEEEDDEVSDLKEGQEKENEDQCNEEEASASVLNKKRKRKKTVKALAEEPNEKKNKTGDLPEETEAALSESHTSSEMSENIPNVNKPAKLSRDRAPKPLLPLGLKRSKKGKSNETGSDNEEKNDNDQTQKEQVNDGESDACRTSGRISPGGEISSEEEEETIKHFGPTRYGRVPKPTVAFACKDESHSSATEANSPSASKSKPKGTLKRGSPLKPQSNQKPKKSKLVTLRSSKSDFSDEDDEEGQVPGVGSSKDSSALVPSGLHSINTVISEVDDPMAELDILASMPDMLSISQDALCPDSSFHQAQHETGSAEACHHQLDLLVDVIDFCTTEQTEVFHDESYNEAAQTLLTIGNVNHVSQSAQKEVIPHGYTSEMAADKTQPDLSDGKILPSVQDECALATLPTPCPQKMQEISETVACMNPETSEMSSGDTSRLKTSEQIGDEQKTRSSNNNSQSTKRARFSKVRPKPNVERTSRTAASTPETEMSKEKKVEESRLDAAAEGTSAVKEISLHRSDSEALLKDGESLKEVQGCSLSREVILATHKEPHITPQDCIGETDLSNSLISKSEEKLVLQETSTDSVQDGNIEHPPPEKDLSANQKEMGAATTRRSRISKIKPHLPQKSRSTLNKSQINREKEEKEPLTGSEPKPLEQTINNVETSSTSFNLMEDLPAGEVKKKQVEVEPQGEHQNTPEEQSDSEPQPEQGSNAGLIADPQEICSANLILPVEDRPAGEQESKVPPAGQLRRSRLPKVKPTPNLTQTSRTMKMKPQSPAETVVKSPGLHPELPTKSTVQVSLETESTSTSEQKLILKEKTFASEEEKTSSELVDQKDKKQTTGDSESVSKLTDKNSVSPSETSESSCNDAITSNIVPTNFDLHPVQDQRGQPAVFVRPEAESSVCKHDGETIGQQRRNRLSKLKPKPNIPQTSRSARLKAETPENQSGNHADPEHDVTGLEQNQTISEIPNKDTDPASDSISPPTSECIVRPLEKKEMGSDDQEGMNAASSDTKEQDSTVSPGLHEEQESVSVENLKADHRCLITKSNQALIDQTLKEPQCGQQSNLNSEAVPERSDHPEAYIAASEELPVIPKEDKKPSVSQVRRSRSQKPKPNLSQTSRAIKTKAQSPAETTVKSPGSHPKLATKSTVKVPLQTPSTSTSEQQLVATDSALRLNPPLTSDSINLLKEMPSINEEEKTSSELVNQKDMEAGSNQSATDDQNSTPVTAERNRNQTTDDSESVSKLMDKDSVSLSESSCNDAMTLSIVPTNFDLHQVQVQRGQPAVFVRPEEESSVCKHDGETIGQPRRNRLSKLKPKPNIPQTSRSARLKAETPENQSGKQADPEHEVRGLEQSPAFSEILNKDTDSASGSTLPLLSGSIVRPLEIKEMGSDDQEGVNAAASDTKEQDSTVSPGLHEKQESVSDENLKADHRCLITKSNQALIDQTLKEPHCGQESNLNSEAVPERSDHPEAYIAASEELPVIPKEDKMPTVSKVRRSRSQKPKPNLSQTSRAIKTKPQSPAETTVKSPGSHPKLPTKSTVQVPLQTPSTSTSEQQLVATGSALHLNPLLTSDSINLLKEMPSTNEEEKTSSELVNQKDMEAGSNQSATDDQNSTPVTAERNRNQTTNDSESVSKLMDKDSVSPSETSENSCNDSVTSNIVPTNFDLHQVQDQRGQPAVFVSPEEESSFCKHDSETIGQQKRNRLSKLKPKPNIPQTSRSARLKAETPENQSGKQADPEHEVRGLEQSPAFSEILNKDTDSASGSTLPLLSGSIVRPLEIKEMGSDDQEGVNAAASDTKEQDSTVSPGLHEKQESVSDENLKADHRCLITKSNQALIDQTLKEPHCGQESNLNSEAVPERSDHPEAYIAASEELPVIPKEDKMPTVSKVRRSRSQKPKPNLSQTSRAIKTKPQSPAETTVKSPGSHPKLPTKSTVQVPLQTPSTSTSEQQLVATGSALRLNPLLTSDSINLLKEMPSTNEEEKTSSELVNQKDMEAGSNQSATDDQNSTPVTAERNRNQTTNDSESVSKLMDKDSVSPSETSENSCNDSVTSNIVPTNFDLHQVQDQRGQPAVFVSPEEESSFCKHDSETIGQQKRNRLSKLKPKPNIPQTSRSARLKAETPENQSGKQADPEHKVTGLDQSPTFSEILNKDTDPASDLTTPPTSECSVRPSEIKEMGSDDQEGMNAAASATKEQISTVSPGLHEEQEPASVENLKADHRSLITKSHHALIDRTVKEPQCGQESNLNSEAASETSDHPEAYITGSEELPVIPKEDKMPSVCQVRRSRLQKPKPNLSQTSRPSRSKHEDKAPVQPKLGEQRTAMEEEKCSKFTDANLTPQDGVSESMNAAPTVDSPSTSLQKGSTFNIDALVQDRTKPTNVGNWPAGDQQEEKSNAEKSIEKPQSPNPEEKRETEKKTLTNVGQVSTSVVTEKSTPTRRQRFSKPKPNLKSSCGVGKLQSDKHSRPSEEKPSAVSLEQQTDSCKMTMSDNDPGEPESLSSGVGGLDMPSLVYSSNTQTDAPQTAITNIPSTSNTSVSPPKRGSSVQGDVTPSELTGSSKASGKAARGRLNKPKPNLRCSSRPQQTQAVGKTQSTGSDSDSSSHPLRTSGDQKPASELGACSKEQEERLIRKQNEKDTNSNNASQCEHKEGSTSEHQTSSTEGIQRDSLLSALLPEQVPSDPDEPFFILSLTEIPVTSAGGVGMSEAENLTYLPATDTSGQQSSTSGVPSLCSTTGASLESGVHPEITVEPIAINTIAEPSKTIDDVADKKSRRTRKAEASTSSISEPSVTESRNPPTRKAAKTRSRGKSTSGASHMSSSEPNLSASNYSIPRKTKSPTTVGAPIDLTSSSTAPTSPERESGFVEEEPTSVSQFFLSDIFTEVEEE
ncbi:transcription factor TFIIIB component B'' homolog isoform X2 [Cyprinodon tularosa]|uniref:transcription factor TFIIIB component B'' homolog isoform X2 n=1 Tax=Cyprinodon tularosa TaxID=77115 RepID=UPI0018E1F2A9|nr:transcription factor TFIIIB component B'' homolog isoform X2 [Cyprinodon tularosa]